MRSYRNKKMNKYFLLLLLLGVSVGFALLSTTLKINGNFGVKGSTWDIHWENVQPNVNSSVTTDKPSIDTTRTIVTYEVNLELPGDYYEFDVDAKNDGSIAGTITDVRHSARKVVEEGQDSTVPDYIKYSVVYKGTNLNPSIGDVLGSGDKQTYTIRVEFDKDATEVPEEDTTIRFEDEIDYGQLDTRGKYKITFDDNGGVAYPTSKYITQGERIGELPTATKENNILTGWKTITGDRITSGYIPNSDMTVIANWTDSYATFNTGYDVNSAFKRLANNDYSAITSVEKSDTAPGDGITTEVVSVEGSTPILAWYDNGSIKLYSEADYLVLNATAANMFANLTNATSIYTNYITSNTTDMTSLFLNCSSLESLNLSSFDTSKVIYMSSTFSNIGVTSLDVSSFDTSSVQSMSSMFQDTKFSTIDLSGFNTSNVEYMYSMFYRSDIVNVDLSNFDISKSYNSMGSMFYNCNKLDTVNLSNLDFSKYSSSGLFSGNMSLQYSSVKKIILDNAKLPASLSEFFGNISSLEEISLKNADTSQTTNMYNMFYNSSNLKKIDFTGINTGNVTDMRYMFYNCSSLEELDLSGFDTKKVTLMDYMFYNCSSLKKINFSSFDTSNVTSMYDMFEKCSSLEELDLSSFNTRKVTSMGYMFYGDSNLKTIIVGDNFVVSQVTSSSSMFYNDTSIVGGKGTVYDSTKTDKEYARYDKGVKSPGYFTKADLQSFTITFDSNGGSQLVPSTMEIEEYDSIGELPTPTWANHVFLGWYTGVTDGVKVTSDTVPIGNVTYYAHWIPNVGLTYDSNGGVFANSETANVINYQFAIENMTKYSHTANIDDSGVVNGTYASNLATNDVVTIPGADRITIEVWFSTEGVYYDWLAIYPAGVTPSTTNYNDATISGGKLGGGYYSTKPTSDTYHKLYVVDGDTAQFYFKSNNSSNYYGYYAIIKGISFTSSKDNEYVEPTRTDYEFAGWNSKADGTGNSYKNEKEILNDVENFSTTETVYAMWKKKHTITFNANGGTVSEQTRRVVDGNKVGQLPIPTNGDIPFLGWYTELDGGVKIDEKTEPTGDITYYAHWSTSYAIFDTGQNVNTKLKTLAGDTLNENYPHQTEDLNIIKILKSDTAPNTNLQTIDHEIQATTSQAKIYAWYENGTIYWWTNASDIFLNQDASHMFTYMKNLNEVDIQFSTSLTTNMYNMFYYCQSINKLDLSSFDTSNVINMNYMFDSCYNLKELNISNWDFRKYNPSGRLTTNVMNSGGRSIKKLIMDNDIFPENMSYAFSEMRDVEEMSFKNVDTSLVTNFERAFYFYNDNSHVNLNLDLTSFDTSNVTNMAFMFYDNEGLRSVDLSSFDTSKVKTMVEMFMYCDNIKSLDLSSFNTSSLVDKIDYSQAGMYMIFYECKSLEEINLSNIDFSFMGNTPSLHSYIGNLESWNNLKTLIFDNAVLPPDMGNGFSWLTKLEEISFVNTDTSNVTKMSSMFGNCTSLKELDLSSFDTSKVTQMDAMFNNMTELQTILVDDKFVVDQVTNSTSMFYNDTKLVGGKGTTYNSNYIDKTYAHYDYGQIDPGYFSSRELSSYEITFNANGGTVAPSSRNVRENRGIGELPIPKLSKHVFLGWYTDLVGGVKVTSDYVPSGNMTLYARWRNSEIYTITFNGNGGQVNPTSIEVYEGDSIGQFPTATKTNYVIKGWYTDLINGVKIDETYMPSGNETLYAKWKVDFENDSWDVIDEIAEDNPTTLCEYFEIGDTKTISIGEHGNHVVRISNCSYSESLDTNTAKSQTANGLVIEFADSLGQRRMNSFDSNLGNVNGNGVKGGWEYSEMREFLNQDIYNALPSDLQSAINEVRVYSGYGRSDNANFVTNDKLYLLSPMEVFGGDAYDSSDQNVHDKATSTTRQLDFYISRIYNLPICTAGRTCEKSKKYLPYRTPENWGSNYIWWWLRNVDYNMGEDNTNGGNFGIAHIHNDMLYSYSDGSNVTGEMVGIYAHVSPAFRLR